MALYCVTVTGVAVIGDICTRESERCMCIVHLSVSPLVELLDDLRDEPRVFEALAALHDAHDARLDLVLAVLLHAPTGLVPLRLAVPLLRRRRLLDLHPASCQVFINVPFR